MTLDRKSLGGGLGSVRSQFQKGEEIASNYNNGPGGMNYLKVNEGFNDFRLFPSTNPRGSFIYLRHVYKMECQVTDSDGKVELKKKHIFNSKTHGKTEKDVVDEYIAFTEARVKEQLEMQGLDDAAFKAQLKQRMAPINDWKTGLKPEFKWCGYALQLQFDKQTAQETSAQRGSIDLAFSVGKKIDALAASFDRRGQVSEIDPFSNPDDGGILVIDYDKKRDPADMYRVTLDTNIKRPLTDEDIAWLGEQRTLEEQYVMSYTRRDFNMAVDGLQRFDQKNGYGTFQNDSFVQIVKEISTYYPADEKVAMRDHGINTSANPFDYKEQLAQTPAPQAHRSQQGSIHASQGSALQPTQQPAQQPVQPEAVQQQAAQTPPSPAQLSPRDELINYITTKGLQITVHPTHTDDQIRQFIQQEEALLAQENGNQAPPPPPAAGQPSSDPSGLQDKVGGLF